jgi:hypothetical protein
LSQVSGPELFDRHHELAGVALGPRLVDWPLDQAGMDLERMQGQRAREAHEWMGLVTLGQRLERRVRERAVGPGDDERPVAVGQELHTLLSDERSNVAPGRAEEPERVGARMLEAAARSVPSIRLSFVG